MAQAATGKRANRRVYRASHKATIIGIVVILAILSVNAGIVFVVIKRQAKDSSKVNGVAIKVDQGVLDQLGVNKSPVGTGNEELIVTPNTQFNGGVSIGGSVNVDKELKVNNGITGATATLAHLQAGDTSVNTLTDNGDVTANSANLRNNLVVTGTSQMQGAVTINQLLTVNSNMNVTGNLNVGGTFTASVFSARSLTSTSTLTIGGHVVTGGLTPFISGGAVGSGGTVSVSGNDSSGIVVINTGQNPGTGMLAAVTFRTSYGSTPHVVIGPSNQNAGNLNFYATRSTSGFTLGSNNAPASGTNYTFDYIVEQ